MVLENSENDGVSEVGNSEDDDFFEKQLNQPIKIDSEKMTKR